MSKIKYFEDGSSIEWVDKESLRYTEGGYSVLVWVDFEPGFFSNGRIIKSSSVTTWETKPYNNCDSIDENTKNRIIDKVIEYYKSINKKCRVE